MSIQYLQGKKELFYYTQPLEQCHVHLLSGDILRFRCLGRLLVNLYIVQSDSISFSVSSVLSFVGVASTESNVVVLLNNV